MTSIDLISTRIQCYSAMCNFTNDLMIYFASSLPSFYVYWMYKNEYLKSKSDERGITLEYTWWGAQQPSFPMPATNSMNKLAMPHNWEYWH